MDKSVHSVLLATLIITSTLILPLNAQILWDNEGVPLRQGDHLVWGRASAQNSQGEICLAWSDCRDGYRKVYAQKLSPDGSQLWNPDGVRIGSLLANNDPPAVCAADDDGFIIVWADLSTDTLGNLRAQRLDNAGNLLWGENGVEVCSIPGEQKFPHIIGDSTGGWFIVWEGREDYYYYDLFALRLMEDGSVAPGWQTGGNVVCSEPESQIYWGAGQKICQDGAGGVIVTWHDYRNSGNADIYAQRMSADGMPLWTDGGIPVCDADYHQECPAIAPDDDGGAFIAWQDSRNSYTSHEDIYIQRIGPGGDFYFADDGIPVSQAERYQNNVRLIPDEAGGVYLAWEDYRNELLLLYADVYAQRIDETGALLWNPEAVPICNAPEEQYQIMIAGGENGLYVVWQDDRDGPAPHSNIYAQSLDPAGQIQWPADGIPVCEAEYYQAEPVLYLHDNDDIHFLWLNHTLESGIFQQITDEAGVLQLPAEGLPVQTGIAGTIHEFDLIAMDNSNFLAVWEDNRQVYWGGKIFYQRLDIEGTTLLETNGLPLCPVAMNSDQGHPETARLSDGSMIAVFEDSDEEFFYIPRICAQRIDVQGNILWGDRGIFVSDTTYWLNAENPRVCADENGGAFIAFQEYDDNFELKVYVKYIDADGNFPWGEQQIRVSTGDHDEFVWGITPDTDGSVIVVWKEGHFIYGYDVCAAKVTADGEVAWSMAVCDADGSENYLSTIPLIEGGVWIAWDDWRNFDESDIYMQKLDGNGQTVWEDNGIPIIELTGDQDQVALIQDVDEFIWAVWQDARNGVNNDLYCQKFTPDGERLFEESGLPVCVIPEGDQWQADIMIDGAGGVYIVWEDYRNTATTADIYAVHLNSSGELADPVWQENGNIVCNVNERQLAPQIVSDGTGGVITAWKDGRSSSYEEEILNLYAQRINDFSTAVGSGNTPALPQDFALHPVYPNPFNSSVEIRYEIPSDAKVRLTVYNTLGQEAAVLAEGWETAGNHEVKFDASGLTSGIYFIRLSAEGHTLVQKTILLK